MAQKIETFINSPINQAVSAVTKSGEGFDSRA
jgi:chromosome segregation ATPase